MLTLSLYSGGCTAQAEQTASFSARTRPSELFITTFYLNEFSHPALRWERRNVNLLRKVWSDLRDDHLQSDPVLFLSFFPPCALSFPCSFSTLAPISYHTLPPPLPCVTREINEYDRPTAFYAQLFQPGAWDIARE